MVETPLQACCLPPEAAQEVLVVWYRLLVGQAEEMVASVQALEVVLRRRRL